MTTRMGMLPELVCDPNGYVLLAVGASVELAPAPYETFNSGRFFLESLVMPDISSFAHLR
jgi:hypothetical protein